jgi:hypothetical protein
MMTSRWGPRLIRHGSEGGGGTKKKDKSRQTQTTETASLNIALAFQSSNEPLRHNWAVGARYGVGNVDHLGSGVGVGVGVQRWKSRIHTAFLSKNKRCVILSEREKEKEREWEMGRTNTTA